MQDFENFFENSEYHIIEPEFPQLPQIYDELIEDFSAEAYNKKIKSTNKIYVDSLWEKLSLEATMNINNNEQSEEILPITNINKKQEQDKNTYESNDNDNKLYSETPVLSQYEYIENDLMLKNELSELKQKYYLLEKELSELKEKYNINTPSNLKKDKQNTLLKEENKLLKDKFLKDISISNIINFELLVYESINKTQEDLILQNLNNINILAAYKAISKIELSIEKRESFEINSIKHNNNVYNNHINENIKKIQNLVQKSGMVNLQKKIDYEKANTLKKEHERHTNLLNLYSKDNLNNSLNNNLNNNINIKSEKHLNANMNANTNMNANVTVNADNENNNNTDDETQNKSKLNGSQPMVLNTRITHTPPIKIIKNEDLYYSKKDNKTSINLLLQKFDNYMKKGVSNKKFHLDELSNNQSFIQVKNNGQNHKSDDIGDLNNQNEIEILKTNQKIRDDYFKVLSNGNHNKLIFYRNLYNLITSDYQKKFNKTDANASNFSIHSGDIDSEAYRINTCNDYKHDKTQTHTHTQTQTQPNKVTKSVSPIAVKGNADILYKGKTMHKKSYDFNTINKDKYYNIKLKKLKEFFKDNNEKEDISGKGSSKVSVANSSFYNLPNIN